VAPRLLEKTVAFPLQQALKMPAKSIDGWSPPPKTMNSWAQRRVWINNDFRWLRRNFVVPVRKKANMESSVSNDVPKVALMWRKQWRLPSAILDLRSTHASVWIALFIGQAVHGVHPCFVRSWSSTACYGLFRQRRNDPRWYPVNCGGC